MPVKNTPSKKLKISKLAGRKSIEGSTVETEGIVAEPIKAKAKAPIELEDHEGGSIMDEKPESDPLLPEEENDEFGGEELELEEEIDPFGDKFEL